MSYINSQWKIKSKALKFPSWESAIKIRGITYGVHIYGLFKEDIVGDNKGRVLSA